MLNFNTRKEVTAIPHRQMLHIGRCTLAATMETKSYFTKETIWNEAKTLLQKSFEEGTLPKLEDIPEDERHQVCLAAKNLCSARMGKEIILAFFVRIADEEFWPHDYMTYAIGLTEDTLMVASGRDVVIAPLPYVQEMGIDPNKKELRLFLVMTEYESLYYEDFGFYTKESAAAAMAGWEMLRAVLPMRPAIPACNAQSNKPRYLDCGRTPVRTNDKTILTISGCADGVLQFEEIEDPNAEYYCGSDTEGYKVCKFRLSEGDTPWVDGLAPVVATVAENDASGDGWIYNVVCNIKDGHGNVQEDAVKKAADELMQVIPSITNGLAKKEEMPFYTKISIPVGFGCNEDMSKWPEVLSLLNEAFDIAIQDTPAMFFIVAED